LSANRGGLDISRNILTLQNKVPNGGGDQNNNNKPDNFFSGKKSAHTHKI
jgi:hypothetical protein